MKKYYVTITEKLERTIEVMADSRENALSQAEDQYKNGEIILDYEDLEDTNYEVYKEEEGYTVIPF